MMQTVKTSQRKEVKLMSKLKALTLSILCAVTTVEFYLQQNFTFMWILLALTLLFLSLWAYKFQRDHRIVTQARHQDEVAPISQPAPQASEGSHRLFVPPPLNKD
jgi:hypothetical protein